MKTENKSYDKIILELAEKRNKEAAASKAKLAEEKRKQEQEALAYMRPLLDVLDQIRANPDFKDKIWVVRTSPLCFSFGAYRHHRSRELYPWVLSCDYMNCMSQDIVHLRRDNGGSLRNGLTAPIAQADKLIPELIEILTKMITVE